MIHASHPPRWFKLDGSMEEIKPTAAVEIIESSEEVRTKERLP